MFGGLCLGVIGRWACSMAVLCWCLYVYVYVYVFMISVLVYGLLFHISTSTLFDTRWHK